MPVERWKLFNNARENAARGNVRAAIEQYEQLLAEAPGDVGVRAAAGELYLKSDEPHHAVPHLCAAADDQLARGYVLRALAIYKRLHDAIPLDDNVALKLAAIYADQGRVVDAQRLYLDVATRRRDDGDVESALQLLRRSAELDVRSQDGQPDLGHRQAVFESYFAAGREFLRRGRYAESVQALQLALVLRPNAKAPIRLLLNALMRTQEPQKAIGMLVTLAERNPHDGELLVLLGRTYMQVGMLAEAVAMFRKTVTSNEPSSCKHLLDVAHRYIETEEWDGAVAALDACVPVLLDTGHDARVIEVLQRIVDASPENAGARARLDWLHRYRATDVPVFGTGQLPGDEEVMPQSPVPELAAPPVEPPMPVPVHSSEGQPFLDELGAPPDEIESLERLKALYEREGMFEKSASVCLQLAGLFQARGGRDQARAMTTEASRLQRMSKPPIAKASASALMSPVDNATGLPSRREFEETLDREWRRALRSARPVAVLFADIDAFEAFNNEHGRRAGDDKLRDIGAALFAVLKRSPDLVCRYDGDSFAVLLPETPLEGARTVAALMRTRVEQMSAPRATVCIGGTAAVPERGTTTAQLVDSARQALRVAHARGPSSVEMNAAELQPVVHGEVLVE